MNAEAIAKDLGGAKRNGKGWLACCPAHDDHDPSLSLNDGDNGKILWHCFSGCSGTEVGRIFKARGYFGDTVPQRLEAPRPKPVQNTRLEWSKGAQVIWDKTQPLEGSLAAVYLAQRGCAMPETDDVRFLPVFDISWGFPRRCSEFPAMVAIIRDAVTGRPITLHFTFLAHDGSGKAPIPKNEQRHLLAGHRSGGGVVHLVDEGDISYGLGLAEGIETALSVMKSGWRPVWAAVNAGNMASFPVRGSSMSLTLFADNDESGAGVNAANTCAARWHAAGRECRIVMPEQCGTDWNDVLKGASA